jgi:hypothetical protein
VSEFTLDRDAYGRLVLTLADASVHVGVVAVRWRELARMPPLAELHPQA